MKFNKGSLIFFLLVCLSARAAYDFSGLAEEYVQKAKECKAQNDIEKALQYYKNAIALKPTDFMLIFNTANLLYNHGYKEEALTYYDRAKDLRPDCAQVYFNKGIVYTQLKKHKEAADCYLQAIELDANYKRAYVNAGLALEQSNQHDKAIDIYKRGIELNPDNADLHHRFGSVLKHKDRFHEAIDHMRKAVQLNKYNAVFKLELANTLHLIDACQEALELYEQILELNPNNYHVLYNFGYTLKKMGYIERAIEVYDRVIEQNPQYPLAHFSRSLSYLTLGDWHRGWPEYEWRWAAYNESPKKFNSPIWDGSDLCNKRILLYAEQGLGDTIQFIRYAQVMKEQGAYVIVQTQGALKGVLSLCPYIDEVYARGEQLPSSVDYHISLMSLPMIFKTEIETVPHNIPYLFAKPELVDYWHDQLKDDTNLKIGICWQGNPNYRTQFLRQAVAGKSMHVKHFTPLARLEGVSLYSLQKMGGEEQLKELNDVVIRSFGPDFDGSHGRFMDTLAIIKELDLIITIDTGTCHVAGALGVPVWNLLPHPADWRWMLDCTDTPWYDNMRLFRQPTQGDWESVIADCIQALLPVLEGKKTIEQVTQEKGMPRKNKQIDLTMPFEQDRDCQKTRQSKPSEQAQKLATIDTQAFDFEQLSTEKRAPCKPEKTARMPVNKKQPKELKKEELKDLNRLTQQLIALNKQLWEYDKKLKEQPPSVFDDTFVSLAQEVIKTVQQKKNIKDQIKQAALRHPAAHDA